MHYLTIHITYIIDRLNVETDAFMDPPFVGNHNSLPAEVAGLKSPITGPSTFSSATSSAARKGTRKQNRPQDIMKTTSASQKEPSLPHRQRTMENIHEYSPSCTF